VLRVGTSGYSYPKWKGAFYPAGLAADAMLEFYASRFSAVEINNTFYRMPSAAVLEGWAARVPEDFRFVLKASRRITHQNRLVGSEDNLAYLYSQARALGDRLGGVLYQLPPTMRKDAARLQGFLRALPPDARAILEFRHASWLDEEIFELLRSFGVMLCVADADAELPETPALDLTGQGYVRLRRPEYATDELAAWRDRIQATWADAYVIFMHEDDGEAPVLAERFLGLPGSAPSGSAPGDPPPPGPHND
jgi:uncharacterized protein YecE (DUF72 family)